MPLLERGISTLRKAGVAAIYAVTGHRADELRPLLQRHGVTEVYNPHYRDKDMLHSVCMGFRAALTPGHGLLFLPGDVALFSEFSVRQILAEGRSADLVLPTWGGKQGHPVWLGPACLHHVLAHTWECGLREALADFAQGASVKNLGLPDPGLLLDADTEADYLALLKYDTEREIPSRQQCLAMLDWVDTPKKTVDHCKAVADTAMALTHALVRAGLSLNPGLVQAGALLHDIAKGMKHHEEAGAALLCDMGFERVASIVSAHTDLPAASQRAIDERTVVYYADKITLGTTQVTIEDRYAQPLMRWQHDAGAVAAILQRREITYAVEQRIGELIGTRSLCYPIPSGHRQSQQKRSPSLRG
ncbi:MAG: mobA 1 [Holophagaceae bacterium]|nr:mobA 1 [Holophagaceae bacterium]